MNNSFPLISILTPIYNVERYIERCVKSLMEQTYSNLEFVFVNDCTPDNSMNILKSVLAKYPYRENQIKIINHPKNQGVAVARNTLLANATGDYLLWVDADDWIEEKTTKILAEIAYRTNADVICFGAIRHTRNEVAPYMWKVENNNHEFIYDLLGRRTHNALWGRMFKHSLFQERNIRFIENINLGEDLLVLLKFVYYSNNVVSCSETLYHYDYTNNNSLTKTITVKDIIASLKLYDIIEDFFQNRLNISSFLSVKRLDAYLLLIYNACIDGNKEYFYNLQAKVISLKTVSKPTINKWYHFYMLCYNYYSCWLWTRIIYFIKKLRNLMHRLLFCL